MRECYTLLQTGGAGGMLQQDNIFRAALQTGQRGKIRLTGGIHFSREQYHAHR